MTNEAQFPPRATLYKMPGDDMGYDLCSYSSRCIAVPMISEQEHNAIVSDRDTELGKQDGEIIVLKSIFVEKDKEITRLKSQLAIAKEYMTHKDECAVYLGKSDEAECTCGLDECLKKLEG